MSTEVPITRSMKGRIIRIGGADTPKLHFKQDDGNFIVDVDKDTAKQLAKHLFEYGELFLIWKSLPEPEEQPVEENNQSDNSEPF